MSILNAGEEGHRFGRGMTEMTSLFLAIAA